MDIDLTQIPPDAIAQAEASKIKAILPALAGLKKIIQVTEARAKELLNEDPDALDGEWQLKEGAKDRRIVNQESFVESLLSMQNARDDYPISVQDLLAISTFPVGKAETLLMQKFDLPKKMAAEKIDELGDDIVSIGRKSPTLKDCR